MVPEPTAELERDLIQPFQVEATGIRGRLVLLRDSIDAILHAHAYPWPVAQLLAEALTLAALAAGALKFSGILTVQAKGSGAVTFLVADYRTPGHLRGFAQFDASAFDHAVDNHGANWPAQSEAPIQKLLGDGYLAITIDPDNTTERYQGIVPLEAGTLSECAHGYFRNSEQIETTIRLAAGFQQLAPEVVHYTAGGLMIQRLPEGDPAMLARGAEYDRDHWEDNWRRAVILAASCRRDELTDSRISADTLLYRLFHEDGVRVFQPTALRFHCRCNVSGPLQVLQNLPIEELHALTVNGKVIVTCEFCSKCYAFSPAEIAQMSAER